MKKSGLYLKTSAILGMFAGMDIIDGAPSRIYEKRKVPQHIQDQIIAKAESKRKRKAKKRIRDLSFTKKY